MFILVSKFFPVPFIFFPFLLNCWLAFPKDKSVVCTSRYKLRFVIELVPGLAAMPVRSESIEGDSFHDS